MAEKLSRAVGHRRRPVFTYFVVGTLMCVMPPIVALILFVLGRPIPGGLALWLVHLPTLAWICTMVVCALMTWVDRGETVALTGRQLQASGWVPAAALPQECIAAMETRPVTGLFSLGQYISGSFLSAGPRPAFFLVGKVGGREAYIWAYDQAARVNTETMMLAFGGGDPDLRFHVGRESEPYKRFQDQPVGIFQSGLQLRGWVNGDARWPLKCTESGLPDTTMRRLAAALSSTSRTVELGVSKGWVFAVGGELAPKEPWTEAVLIEFLKEAELLAACL